MKFSVSLTLQLLGATAVYNANHASAATCNADNCLRALFPTNDPNRLATASAFCQAFTQPTIAASTTYANPTFPARATSACGTASSRYSSACSCAPTIKATQTTASPTSTACASDPETSIIRNGGFECGGLGPWAASSRFPDQTRYGVTQPGHSSNNAFEIDATKSPSTNGQELASVEQTTTRTVANAKYVLNFFTYITSGSAGFWGVKINGQPVYTVDASDKAGPGVWNFNTVEFIATGATTVRFEALTSEAGAVFKLDDVQILAV